MGWGPPSGSVSLGKDRLLTGQSDALWIPKRVTRRYPILYFPPGADVATVGIDPIAEPGERAFLAALRNAGAVVVACDWDGGTTDYGHAWGNPKVRADAETVRGLLATVLAAAGCPDLGFLDTSKIVAASGSQGAFDAFGYAEDQPSRVRAIGAWAGATDLQGFRSGTYRWGGNGGSANRSSIDLAWGVTYPAALPATADPYDNASSITCPVMLAYSDADATVTPASQAAMAAALPNGKTIRTSTTSPHGDAEALDATSGGLVDWLLQQAA
jgi:pimeloyl-ACP methyl ester carboxylesterase